MQIIKSDLVGCRSDLARLCDDRKITLAAEIGVDRGIFAAEFLSKWHGETLFCVDNWESYPEMPYDRTCDMMMAVQVLSHEAKRVKIVRASSKEASYLFGKTPNWPTQLGFVYIDAGHTYSSVANDIYYWWPIIYPGGILSGDDFDEHHPGVIEAVRNFAEANGLDIYLTTDYNRGPSWFIHKPK